MTAAAVASRTALAGRASLRRRLLPLQVGIACQGFLLWVPVEKLFMTEIGFTAASVGVMAAAYAAIVPLLEIPSGVLADRWSRRGVLVLGAVALGVSTLVGGLSAGVPSYIAAAMILGVHFAMSSGTLDAVVYDVVLETTGSSDGYEREIGRVRLIEGAAFVTSALAGGLLAEWSTTRATYLWSLPAIGVAVVALLMIKEPRLHQQSEPVALRTHLTLTLRAMVRSRQVVGIVGLAALASVAAQVLFEFGPLWLVAFAAPAVIYGPYWAVLVSTLGLGGLLAGRLRLQARSPAATMAAAVTAAAIILAWTAALPVVIAAQILLALGMVLIGIHASRLLHDAVPSKIRAGVASGVGTLSWLVFLPVAVTVGWLARGQSVHSVGWLLAGTTAAAALLLIGASSRRRLPVHEPEPPAPPLAPTNQVSTEGPELTCRDTVELATDLSERALNAEQQARCRDHLADCDGCREYLHQMQQTAAALRATHADVHPSAS